MLRLLIVAALLIVGLLWYLLAMKRQLRGISKELERTAEQNYNRLMQISLFDRDLTDMTASLNRCLERQKQFKLTAERAENNLRQSVSDIAHDLRTPLSVIKGDLQLMECEEQLPENCREYVKICLEKTDLLRQMTDEFFELVLLESDPAPAVCSSVNVTNMLMNLIAAHEGNIRLAGLTPEIVLPPKSVFALADAAFLERMLNNLLSNVLKYADGLFRIVLQAEPECEICFENPLPPDAEPDPEQLFNRNYRGSRSRSGGGAGLGLYIVKLLAEKQQAQVRAEIRNGIMRIILTMQSADTQERKEMP
jgi:signal transduction histidine kinase